MNEGCFHKNYIHIGTFGMSYLLKMDLLQRVSDFSYLLHSDGRHWNRSMRVTKELRSTCWKQGNQGWHPEGSEKYIICQASSKAAKHIGNVSEVPIHAWHSHGTDLFYWNKMDYLLVGDYFSKFLIVRKIPYTSTHVVIKELGMIFTEFGRPFVLKSDNDLCYTSREFHDLLEFYKIHQITSSLYYPKSNGFAEASVGISKKLMEKSVKDGKLWNNGLLEYQVTPVSGNLPSPLEVLTGCKPGTSLTNSFKCWEINGNIQISPGIAEKTTQYFKPS